MTQFQHMNRQEIDEALEEVFGRERWETIKNSSHVNKLIENSTCNQLLQSNPKDRITSDGRNDYRPYYPLVKQKQNE